MAIRRSKHQGRIQGRGKVRFEFDCRVGGRRIIRTCICHPNQADRLYQKWLTTLSENQTKPKAQKQMLFQIRDKYLSTQQESIKLRRQRLVALNSFSAFCGDMPVNDIRRYHVQDWLNSLTLKPGSKKTYRMLLSGLFSWCIEREIISINPCGGIKDGPLPTRHPKVTLAQFSEIIEKCDGSLRTSVMLALYAGLRIGEISSLQWSDLDFGMKLITIRAEVSKSKRARSIPMADTLREYLLERRGIGRVIPLSIDAIREQFGRAKKSFSFDSGDFRFHDLRHLFALKSAAAGVPLQTVSEWLGHSSLLITQKAYVQSVQSERAHDKMELLDRLIAGR